MALSARALLSTRPDFRAYSYGSTSGQRMCCTVQSAPLQRQQACKPRTRLRIFAKRISTATGAASSCLRDCEELSVSPSTMYARQSRVLLRCACSSAWKYSCLAYTKGHVASSISINKSRNFKIAPAGSTGGQHVQSKSVQYVMCLQPLSGHGVTRSRASANEETSITSSHDTEQYPARIKREDTGADWQRNPISVGDCYGGAADQVEGIGEPFTETDIRAELEKEGQQSESMPKVYDAFEAVAEDYYAAHTSDSSYEMGDAQGTQIDLRVGPSSPPLLHSQSTDAVNAAAMLPPLSAESSLYIEGAQGALSGSKASTKNIEDKVSNLSPTASEGSSLGVRSESKLRGGYSDASVSDIDGGESTEEGIENVDKGPPRGPAYLQELRIRDFALIQEERVEFGPGLNIITGESGAGKSILLQALGQVLGAPMAEDSVRPPATSALLQGIFSVGPAVRASLASLLTGQAPAAAATLKAGDMATAHGDSDADVYQTVVLEREILRGASSASTAYGASSANSTNGATSAPGTLLQLLLSSSSRV
eukprot:jgi/Mesen1/4954/ME000247S04234